MFAKLHTQQELPFKKEWTWWNVCNSHMKYFHNWFPNQTIFYVSKKNCWSKKPKKSFTTCVSVDVLVLFVAGSGLGRPVFFHRLFFSVEQGLIFVDSWRTWFFHLQNIHLQHTENEHDWLENPLFFNGRYIFKWWMFHCYVSFAKTPWKLSWEKPFKNLGQLIREFFVWVRDRIFQIFPVWPLEKCLFLILQYELPSWNLIMLHFPLLEGEQRLKPSRFLMVDWYQGHGDQPFPLTFNLHILPMEGGECF